MFIDQLSRNFKITTGTLGSFLKIQIEQRQDGIFVCRRVNAGKILERLKKHEANSVAMHCDDSSGGSEASVGRFDLWYRLLTSHYIM